MSSNQVDALVVLAIFSFLALIPTIGASWSKARWWFLAAGILIAPPLMRLYIFAVLG